MSYIPKKVLVGFETKFGETPETPTPYQLCVKTNGLTSSIETKSDDCIGGHIDSGGEKVQIGTTNEGDIESTMYWEQLVIYHKAILGDVAVVDNADGTYAHTLDSTKESIPSMYVETTIVGDTIINEVFNGVMGTNLSTSFRGKGLPEVKLGMLASTHKDTIKDGYQAIDDTNKILLGSTPLNMTYTYVKIDGSDFCKLSEFDITIDRGTGSDDLMCNMKDVGIVKSEVSGKLKSVFDVGLYEKIANNSKVSLEVGYEQTIDGKVHKLSYIMPEVQFSFKTQPKTVGEKVVIDAEWSASRSSESTERLKVVITNTIPTY